MAINEKRRRIRPPFILHHKGEESTVGKMRQDGGFTLMELLVVVAVIAILTSLLVPALSRTKEKAVATRCLNNLRQIGLASTLYMEDTDGDLPQNSRPQVSWIQTLANYLDGTNMFRCTMDRTNRVASYALNDFLTASASTNGDFSKLSKIPNPVDTMQAAEAAETFSGGQFQFANPRHGGHTPEAFRNQVAVERHYRGANYLYLDSHISYLRARTVDELLTRPGSRFINPAGFQP